MRILEGPVELLDLLRPRVGAREAELNLVIGVASSGRSGMVAVALEQGSRVRAVALCEAPYNIMLATFDDAAADALADRLADAGMFVDAPGVVGTAPAVSRFSQRFATRLGRGATRVMSQRILKLTKVGAAPAPQGQFRVAIPDDVGHVAPWFAAFAQEAGGGSIGVEDRLAKARARIGSGSLFLWETSRPVSMAALARETWTGIAVNAVYTPPEARCRGYASACVAALSQHALDGGREFCMLFTDATNATSNRIYERIGYRFVCHSEEWRFD